MVFLGFGKYARADKIYALEPLVGDERGGGRRTRVWVEGIPDAIVAARTERTILQDMGQEAAGVGPLLDDHQLHALQARELDQLIHHVAGRGQPRAAEGAAAALKRQEVVLSAHPARLLQMNAYEELADHEAVGHLDHGSQTADEHASGLVVAQPSQRRLLLAAAPPHQRSLDLLPPLPALPMWGEVQTADDPGPERVRQESVQLGQLRG